MMASPVVAQTGIDTQTPDPDASLELGATDKGLLLNRVALTDTASSAPLSAHVTGMTVYNTATAGDVTPGYYYNNGTQWIRIGNPDEEPFRNVSDGSGATNTSTDVYYSGGNVGIGTNAPSQLLHINGTMRITDGTEGTGKVLASDANGVATWSTTVTTAFADDWTPASGTLVDPFTGSTGGAGLNTGLSVVIPEKGWYFFRCGLTIQSDCNDYSFYINGIGDVWRVYCNAATTQLMSPRDQNRVLYFATPGTYTVLARKTNAVVPTFNIGNPAFYLDFVKFQN